MSLVDDLESRGLITNLTPEAKDALESQKLTGYIGFDPTASSLHVGSLVPALVLARMQRHGHKPIAVVGGGTGLIGDPSGKSQERQLLDKEQIAINLEGIRGQLARFLDFDCGDNAAEIVDNAEWLSTIALTDFLRDVGKNFSVNVMLARESVKRRLESEDGISFTEFSYQLLQAWDFQKLYESHGCTLQMGGSDQWGNIVAGIDLIRRNHAVAAHGIVFPLITTSSGTKFGKTEAGAIWLDPERTSDYRFYQFWLNTNDADVINYLNYFTFLEPEEIDAERAELEASPHERQAHRRLAKEVTALVRGEEAVERAERISELFFGGRISELSATEVLDAAAGAPSAEIEKTELEGEGIGIVDLLHRAGVAPSRKEARRLVTGGGIYLYDDRVTDAEARIGVDQSLDGELVLLRKGKKNHFVVRLV